MKTRAQNKGSSGEDPDEESRMNGEKKRKFIEAPRARPTVSNGLGASPAKKPRTNRRRVPGSKIPPFLFGETEIEEDKEEKDEKEEKEEKEEKVEVEPEKLNEQLNEYDFENVVQAIAQTLAEQNGSGNKAPSPRSEEDVKTGEVEETSEDDGNTTKPAKRKTMNGVVRRPPSKRIRNQREREQELLKKREEEEDAKVLKARVLPQRSKKKSKILSGELSDLEALITLADICEAAPSHTDKEADGDRQELEQDALNILSLQQNKQEKQPTVSPRKKKRPSTKASGEPSTSSKGEDKSIVYKAQGRTKRISTKGSHKHDEDENKKDKRAEHERPHCSHSEIGSASLKARALHCLSSKVRQWSVYEWFYSAIDLPWFANNDFVDYLNHAGIRHVSKLTRLEWSVIRNSLGKPRRLSQKFLQEEREKLRKYRESVRATYYELRNDKSGLSLPADLARPLTVGQRVIARHPKTRDVYDGSILTVDRNRCRVQFDSPELGVEFVLDIDAMPVIPLDNMSEKMRKTRMVDVSTGRMGARVVPDRSTHFATPNDFFLSTLCQRAEMDNVDSVILAKAAAEQAVAAVQQAGHEHSAAPDICDVFVDLQFKLDKKEALLVELRRMHDEADEAEPSVNSDTYKRDYATVVLQLREINVEVKRALEKLKERNKYQETVVPPWHSPPPPTDVTSGLGAGSLAEEITLAARKEAKALVSAAVQGACYLKEGEDALYNLGKLPNHGQPANEGTANNQPQGSDKTDSSLQHAGTGTDKQKRQPSVAFSTAMKSVIPAEYITSCISTVLTIQMCSEKYSLPSADVAVVLDNALSHLRPRSAQNHQLYKEIEQLLDVIKKQVTAQVPLHPGIVPL